MNLGFRRLERSGSDSACSLEQLTPGAYGSGTWKIEALAGPGWKKNTGGRDALERVKRYFYIRSIC